MMRYKWIIAALMTLLFSGMCIIENSVVAERPKSQDDTSSVYMLAGEFRCVFANLLWIKAEQYHHEYTARNANWTKDKELLGLIKLITKLDPHFPEAYEVGAYLYADGQKDNKAAMKFLLEGIYNNPKQWDLHHLAAIMYGHRLHNRKLALAHAKLALKYCDDEFYRSSIRRLIVTLQTK